MNPLFPAREDVRRHTTDLFPDTTPVPQAGRRHLSWMSRVSAHVVRFESNHGVVLAVAPGDRTWEEQEVVASLEDLDLFDPPAPPPHPGDAWPWPLRVVSAPGKELLIGDRRPIRRTTGRWELVVSVEGAPSGYRLFLGGRRLHGPIDVTGDRVRAWMKEEATVLPAEAERSLFCVGLDGVGLDDARAEDDLDRALEHAPDLLEWMEQHFVAGSLRPATERRHQALDRDRQVLLSLTGDGGEE